MSFLALSSLQVILLAAATAGAVLTLFFLKLRHHRVVVGSSLLWQRVLDHRHTSSIWERIRRWVSLLIALTIALLIALSLGRPYLGGGVERPSDPTILVLDTSPSMMTRMSSGRTRWETATEQARLLLESSDASPGFMVADTAGHVLTSFTQDRDVASRAIERMEPFGVGGAFPSVPTEDVNLVFVTDGVDRLEVPPTAKVVSVFEAADNIGITAFEIRVDPSSRSGYTAYLEVANYSAEPKAARVVISGVGGRGLSQDLSIEAGEIWNVSVDLADFEGGGIRAGLQSSGDAFELDDVAFSYLPTAENNRVTLVTNSVEGYLEKLLSLSPRVELSVVRTSEFEDDSSGDAYVFEDFVPDSRPTLPSLFFGVAPADWLPPTRGDQEELRITSWLEDHPVMRSVPVYDIRIDRAPVIEVDSGPETLSVIAEAAGVPLIVVESSARPRMVLVAFDLDDSDFPFQIGFPIFVENVIAWFSGEGLAERHALGEIRLPEGTTGVTQLDGTAVRMENRFGSQVMEIAQPGLFTALADGRRIRLAANLTSPNISNVNQTWTETAANLGPMAPVVRNELWIYMLLAAVLLLGIEWWTYNRRITL